MNAPSKFKVAEWPLMARWYCDSGVKVNEKGPNLMV